MLLKSSRVVFRSLPTLGLGYRRERKRRGKEKADKVGMGLQRKLKEKDIFLDPSHELLTHKLHTLSTTATPQGGVAVGERRMEALQVFSTVSRRGEWAENRERVAS